MNQRARGSTRAQWRAHQQAVQRHRHWLWTGVAIAAVLAVAGAIVFAVTRDSEPSKPSTPAAVPRTVSTDGAGLVVGAGPVTVEMYSDFLCPACGYFERDAIDEIETLLASNSIRLVYRPVAILDQASTNKYSTRSAAAASCASDAGKLMPFVKTLFANQPSEGSAGYSDEEMIGLAGSAGVGDPSFAQCVRDKRYVRWIGTVTSAMERKGVDRTPTVIVAGSHLEAPTGDRLIAAVRAAG